MDAPADDIAPAADVLLDGVPHECVLAESGGVGVSDDDSGSLLPGGGVSFAGATAFMDPHCVPVRIGAVLFFGSWRWPLLTLVLRYRLFGHTVRDLEPCMRVITRAAADVYSNRQVLCGAVTKYERRQRMQVARMHDAAWAAAHDGLVLCAEPPSACAYVRLATEGALREFQRQRLQRPRSAPPAWHHAEPAVAPKATRKRARVELETDFRQLSVAANTTREVNGLLYER